MRPSLRATALIASLLGFWRIAGHAREEANIRELARHESCSIDDARRLYALARRHGYGAAYREVFGEADAGRGGNDAGGRLR